MFFSFGPRLKTVSQIPPYTGNPLDPPFRSRFQVRYIDSYDSPFTNQLSVNNTSRDLPQIVGDRLNNIEKVVRTLDYMKRTGKPCQLTRIVLEIIINSMSRGKPSVITALFSDITPPNKSIDRVLPERTDHKNFQSVLPLRKSGL